MAPTSRRNPRDTLQALEVDNNSAQSSNSERMNPRFNRWDHMETKYFRTPEEKISTAKGHSMGSLYQTSDKPLITRIYK